ncbi:MAG: DUF2798 domain-containing protein [Mycoplasmataceae bacterium]|nr:DUF2798 domain-containing protein [Mycoplasmataceae bacterium]
MPKNWKEELIFTLLMVTFIVIGMVTYNLIIHQVVENGDHSFWDFVKSWYTGACIAFLTALVLEFFIVRHIVALIVFKVIKVNPQKPIHMILSIAFVTMAIMCPFMSFVGTVLDVGWSGLSGMEFLNTFWKNVCFIIPLNLLIAGPLSRLIFSKLYKDIEKKNIIRTDELI